MIRVLKETLTCHYMLDLLEFVAGDQKLNINIIQFFMMQVSLPIFQFTLCVIIIDFALTNNL